MGSVGSNPTVSAIKPSKPFGGLFCLVPAEPNECHAGNYDERQGSAATRLRCPAALTRRRSELMEALSSCRLNRPV